MNPWSASSRLVVSAAAVLALGGCGSQTDTADTADAADTASGSATAAPTATAAPPTSDTTTATTAPAVVACDEVWREGADLPRSYTGCDDGSGTVKAEQIDCSSGQFVVVYDDRFWAVRGNVIGYAPDGLGKSDSYQRVMYSCRA